MSIKLEISEFLKKTNKTQQDLADYLGISEVHLSNMINGKSKLLNVNYLEGIARFFNCNVNDFLAYTPSKKIMPMFLDYTGTTDLLISGGAENFKKFLDGILSMQYKFNQERNEDYEVQAYIVTGASKKDAIAKCLPFCKLAKEYGLPNLFKGVIAEYAGYEITSIESMEQYVEKKLDYGEVGRNNSEEINSKKEKIKELIKPYDGYINDGSDQKENYVTTYCNTHFRAKKDAVKEAYIKYYMEEQNMNEVSALICTESKLANLDQKTIDEIYDNPPDILKGNMPKAISKDEFEELVAKIKKVFNNEQTVRVNYCYDEYSIEIDILPANITKAEAVRNIVESINADPNQEIAHVIVGGDDTLEDINMALLNFEIFKKLGIDITTFVPSNINGISEEQEKQINIIKGNWKNIEGIIDCISQFVTGAMVKDDGRITYERI